MVAGSTSVKRRVDATVGLLWLVLLGGVGVLIAVDVELGRIGRSDLQSLHGPTWIILAAITSAAVVGSALVRHHPRHPVGWLFLGLALTMLLSGAIDTYAVYGALARPGSLPAARQAAVIGDGSFVPWLVLVALVLQLTPTGRTLGPRWRTVAQATAALGVLAFASGLVADRTLSAPFAAIRDPMTVTAIAPVARWVGGVSIIGVGLGLVTGAASIVVRFRRARGDDQKQLLWLVIAVIPLPPFVLAAFAASMSDHDAATLIATGGFVVVVPVAAGLSISRYHLYEVDSILNRTLTYVLLTVALIAVYGSIVLLASRGPGSWAGSPRASATLGAVTAALLAAPLRTWLQDAVDRRFNRRGYDAIQQIRAANLTGWAGTDIETLLRQALRDDSVHIRYWLRAREQWVSADGVPSHATGPYVEVARSARVIARIGYNPRAVEHDAVRNAVNEGLVALENIGLRAELAARLRELAQSRARIVAAQHEERKRIERDLHDGAQQRLLALSLQLQAAQLSGDTDRLRSAVPVAIEQARHALEELRELANGIHPAALADGGINGALDDLARRSPIPVHIIGQVDRLDPRTEATAWLIICEALTNVQKHAGADHVRVKIGTCAQVLTVEIADDGQGGANPDGSGLRGIRDRAETAQGTLTVQSPPAHGTVVTARLPCER